MQFETEISHIKILKNSIVRIEGKEGVEVNKDNANAVYDEIEKNVSGDYKVLLVRRNSYSVKPNTYAVMNARDRLIKVAIVVKSHAGIKVASLEQSWCKKTMDIFPTEEQAVHWLDDT